MEGVKNGLIVMASLAAISAVLWVVTKILESMKLEPGGRGDKVVGKVFWGVAIIAGIALIVYGGGGSIDPEFTYR